MGCYSLQINNHSRSRKVHEIQLRERLFILASGLLLWSLRYFDTSRKTLNGLSSDPAPGTGVSARRRGQWAASLSFKPENSRQGRQLNSKITPLI